MRTRAAILISRFKTNQNFQDGGRRESRRTDHGITFSEMKS